MTIIRPDSNDPADAVAGPGPAGFLLQTFWAGPMMGGSAVPPHAIEKLKNFRTEHIDRGGRDSNPRVDLPGPKILAMAPPAVLAAPRSFKPVILGLLALAIFTGGLLSWIASTHRDGLEWSVKGVTGKEEMEAPKEGVHGAMAWIQEKLALLPDYDFKKPEEEKGGKKGESWPDVSTGKSLSGLLGAALTLLMAGAIGFSLRRYYSHNKR